MGWWSGSPPREESTRTEAARHRGARGQLFGRRGDSTMARNELGRPINGDGGCASTTRLREGAGDGAVGRNEVRGAGLAFYRHESLGQACKPRWRQRRTARVRGASRGLARGLGCGVHWRGWAGLLGWRLGRGEKEGSLGRPGEVGERGEGWAGGGPFGPRGCWVFFLFQFYFYFLNKTKMISNRIFKWICHTINS